MGSATDDRLSDGVASVLITVFMVLLYGGALTLALVLRYLYGG